MGRMTNHFLLARDGLPLNPCKKLRNEPKASNPGVCHATKAELIGLQNLRNCSGLVTSGRYPYALNSPSPLCLAHLRFVHSEVMRDLMPDRIGHHLFELCSCAR
jgi:hypothetical protein